MHWLIYFANFVGRKSFKKIEKDDVESFLNQRIKNGDSEGTLFSFKIWIRDFFKWYYGFKRGYPEMVEWMDVSLPKTSKQYDTIEEDDIIKMLQACGNSRDRALLSILVESGARISEILDLRLKDLKEDEYGFVIKVEGKTGSRPIRIVQSVNDLKRWINEHSFKTNQESPLFYSFDDKNFGGFMTGTSGYILVKKTAKIAGIKKNIYPHIFRHSRATNLAKVMSDRQLVKYFGWSDKSDMPAVYSHLTEKDIDDKVLALNGFEVKAVKPMKIPTFECYRCNEVNSAGSKFCIKCNAPLDLETIQKLNSLKSVANEFTERILIEMADKGIDGSDLEEIVKGYMAKSAKN
jgi:integrase